MIPTRLSGIALLCMILAGCSSSPQHRPAAPIVQHPGAHTSPVTTPRRAAMIDVAMQQIGTPYRYGGKSPSGFDCSGLVYYAYRQTGKTVPRSTHAQLQYSRKLSRSELRPGDLVFFRISSNKVSHVGIYIGNNRFVHAPSSGKRVQVSIMDNVYWRPRFISGGRI